MKTKAFPARFAPILLAPWLIIGLPAATAADDAPDFSATSLPVGPQSDGLLTPVNQRISPAGQTVELPGSRPNALALSPDGKLLVTSGLKSELIVLDPATGAILQRVPFPPSASPPTTNATPNPVLTPNKTPQLSFTGLVFSPDGSRIYLANVNGDIKVFAVDKDHDVQPLFSIPLPPAKAPRRKEEIPAGIAVSPDGKRLYVAFNLSNRLAELDAATGQRVAAVGCRRRAVRRGARRSQSSTSATGAGAGPTPTASPARPDRARSCAWTTAPSPAKARCRSLTFAKMFPQSPRPGHPAPNPSHPLEKSSPACTPARWRCRRTDTGSSSPTRAATR